MFNNEAMTINKVQRSRMIFDPSAKIAHVGVPSIYSNKVFSESFRPIELKFHMKTSYDKFAKIYTNRSSHMTKMTNIHIYGKNPLKIFYSKIRRLMTLGLGM